MVTAPLRVHVVWSCLLAACTPHYEKNPRDAEQPFPELSAQHCGDAEVVEVSAFFSGFLLPAADRPDQGTRIAVEGTPQALAMCTSLGCSWECCDNDCGYALDCPYRLSTPDGNEVCLVRADFECGGTDCSPYCAPFSTAPAGHYRFVGTIAYEGPRPTLLVEDVCRVE